MLATEGEIFLAYADAIAATRPHRSASAFGPQAATATLRIGSVAPLIAGTLCGPLRRFHRRWPALEFAISTGATDYLPQAVAAGQLDCAIQPFSIAVEAVCAQLELRCELLWREPLVLIQSGYVSGMTSGLTSALAVVPGCAYHTMGVVASVLSSEVLETVDMPSYEVLLANVVSGRCHAVVPKSLLRAQRGLRGLRTQRIGDTAIVLISPHQRAAALESLRTILRRRVLSWH